MSYVRLAFVAAFVFLIVGIAGGSLLARSLFASDQVPPQLRIVAQNAGGSPASRGAPVRHNHPSLPPTATPTINPVGGTPTVTLLTNTPAPSRSAPTSTPTNTATSTPTGAPAPSSAPGEARGHRVTPKRAVARPTTTPSPTATPSPIPTSTPVGTISLVRFWAGSSVVRSGTVTTMSYVIDNETGQPARLVLGASIKPSAEPSWTASYGDVGDEVTVVAPAGISTVSRNFAVSGALKPGLYDIAWGVRNALNGVQVGLAASNGVLTVTG